MEPVVPWARGNAVGGRGRRRKRRPFASNLGIRRLWVGAQRRAALRNVTNGDVQTTGDRS